MNKQLLKLAKLVMKFAEIETDRGVLTVADELTIGVEVMVDVDGDFVPAEDGEYLTETQKITIKDGKVEMIEDITEEPVEEPKEEVEVEAEEVPVETPAEPDEKDLRIAELEGLIKDRDAIIEELTNRIKELEDKAEAPMEESVQMKAQVRDANPALKYFQ